MNDAMKRYLAINQLIVKGKLPEGYDYSDREVIQKKVDAIPRQHLDEMETLLLKHLRVPSYHLFDVRGKSLSLDGLIDGVRAGSFEVTDCSFWADDTIVQLKATIRSQCQIVDGVLYLSDRYSKDTSYDLVNAMRKAFQLRCWGKDMPNDVCKDVVRYAVNLSNPVGDINMPKGEVEAFVDACVDAEIHPADLGVTAVIAPDLAVTLENLGCLSSWSRDSKRTVTLVVPRGAGVRLATAKLPVAQFVEWCNSEDVDMGQLSVKGSKLVAASKPVAKKEEDTVVEAE